MDAAPRVGPAQVGANLREEDELNLIKEYEQELERRVKAGEITEKTKNTTMYGPAKIPEALVGTLPVSVVEAFVSEWGATGNYGHIIRRLKELALERR